MQLSHSTLRQSHCRHSIDRCRLGAAAPSADHWSYSCSPLSPAHPSAMAQHHKPSSSSSSTTAAYDYAGALTSLSERIAALSAAKQQASVPATRLGAAVSFVRANKSSGLLLLTMYSISTASVAAAIMSEQRLKSESQAEAREQEQLQQEVLRLQHHVAQQQAVLSGLRQDLQQHCSSSSSSPGSSWWPWQRSASAAAAAMQQAMLQRLQQWNGSPGTGGGSVPAHAPTGSSQPQAGNSPTRDARQRQQGQQQDDDGAFGVRVGPMGARGFLI